MKDNKIFETYHELPTWAKGIVVIGGLGILYIVGSTVYKKLFPPPLPQTLQNVNNDIASYSQTYTPTYGSAQYDGFANAIYNAQVSSLGYDSKTIANTLMQMQNDLDVALLAKAYGLRQDYVFGFKIGSTYDLFSASRHGISSDMFGIFSYRIDDVNNDWQSKGITYRI
jgi:hypothetical protein